MGFNGYRYYHGYGYRHRHVASACLYRGEGIIRKWHYKKVASLG